MTDAAYNNISYSLPLPLNHSNNDLLFKKWWKTRISEAIRFHTRNVKKNEIKNLNT